MSYLNMLKDLDFYGTTVITKMLNRYSDRKEISGFTGYFEVTFKPQYILTYLLIITISRNTIV